MGFNAHADETSGGIRLADESNADLAQLGAVIPRGSQRIINELRQREGKWMVPLRMSEIYNA